MCRNSEEVDRSLSFFFFFGSHEGEVKEVFHDFDASLLSFDAFLEETI